MILLAHLMMQIQSKTESLHFQAQCEAPARPLKAFPHLEGTLCVPQTDLLSRLFLITSEHKQNTTNGSMELAAAGADSPEFW